MNKSQLKLQIKQMRKEVRRYARLIQREKARLEKIQAIAGDQQPDGATVHVKAIAEAIEKKVMIEAKIEAYTSMMEAP